MLWSSLGIGMRYFVQFLFPVLIFVGVVYVLTRRRRGQPDLDRDTDRAQGSDTGAFVVILLVSGAVALGTAFLLHAMWE